MRPTRIMPNKGQQGMADLLANEGIHIHQHQASKGDASSDPSKSTSRDIEARSPLDAIDIITTGSQEIENVERHKKNWGKSHIQIRFFLDELLLRTARNYDTEKYALDNRTTHV